MKIFLDADSQTQIHIQNHIQPYLKEINFSLSNQTFLEKLKKILRDTTLYFKKKFTSAHKNQHTGNVAQMLKMGNFYDFKSKSYQKTFILQLVFKRSFDVAFIFKSLKTMCMVWLLCTHSFHCVKF